MEVYTEPSRNLPVLGRWDVAVCGGGPAGCAAALAASRTGARTILLEKGGFLGGVPVVQMALEILSRNGVDLQGVWHEFMSGMKKLGAVRGLVVPDANRRVGPGVKTIWGISDPEAIKHVWEELLTAAGVQILYHCYAATAVVADGAASGVVAETCAGRRVLFAKRVVDATGDGNVCAQAGVAWEQGDGLHPYAMSMTKVFRLGGVRWDPEPFSESEMREIEARIRAAVARGEFTSPVITTLDRLLGAIRRKSFLLPFYRREITCLISRVLKVNPVDPFELSRAEREGRLQAREAAELYKKYVPGCEDAYLLDTAVKIGVRSSRRIRGVATVTAADALGLRRYHDGIARASFTIDVWPATSYTASPDAHPDPNWQVRVNSGECFDIRYGCLVAAGVENLLVAGGCISADHKAQSSARIQQTCMSTGQAAGTAAALSIRDNVPPRLLDPAALTARLHEDRAKVTNAFAELEGLPGFSVA